MKVDGLRSRAIEPDTQSLYCAIPITRGVPAPEASKLRGRRITTFLYKLLRWNESTASQCAGAVSASRPTGVVISSGFDRKHRCTRMAHAPVEDALRP